MTVTQFRHSGAQLSRDLRYRHVLWREWDKQPPYTQGYCTFVMLNPSTADGLVDDPTIRRCMRFVDRLGHNRLEVVNLFDYRTRSPAVLKSLDHEDNPCSSVNQTFIQRSVEHAGTVICAWGAHGCYLGQDQTVIGWLRDATDRELQCFGLTGAGMPKHPLYLKADTPLMSLPV